MDFTSSSQQNEAVRLLTGLENGTLGIVDAYNMALEQDPIVLFLIVKYLKEKYPSSKEQSKGVLARLVELTSTYQDITKILQKSEQDPMREWFQDTYDMREFFNKPEALIATVFEKLES